MSLPVEKEASLIMDPASSGSDTERQVPDEKPPVPPNGGFSAWLQVVGAFFLFFNSWGMVNTFGVFQTYYEQTLLPEYSASSISWIGTVQGFLLLLAGVVVGPIFDKGYIKTCIAIGSFCVIFGLMMTSLSTEYYQVFLTQGLLVGIGSAFLFVPSVATVAVYFTTRRALATGITTSGGSIGSVIYPVIFHKLVGPLGFGWTTRIIAFVALGGLIFSWAVMRGLGAPPKNTRSLVDKTAFKDAPFMIFSLGFFCSFIGLYFPYFYMPTFFSSFLHSNSNIAFYSLAIMNSASVFGRITPGLLADVIGPLNTIIPIGFIASVLAFAWIGIRNEPGTIVFAVLYGYASGATVSLPNSVLGQLTTDMSLIGTRMGMSFTFAAVGILIGNPIAGALLDLENAVFWKAQLFCAATVAVGTALFVGARWAKWKQEQVWKT